VLPESVLSEVGRLDPEAIAEVQRDAWPDVRDADELHDALQTLVLLPASSGESWTELFEQLVSGARGARDGCRVRHWVASERTSACRVLFSDARFEPAPTARLGRSDGGAGRPEPRARLDGARGARDRA
jgi:ATP-dependent Lhr-like helicase